MNKKNFILLVMALCCMTFFSSCDKDDIADVEAKITFADNQELTEELTLTIPSAARDEIIIKFASTILWEVSIKEVNDWCTITSLEKGDAGENLEIVLEASANETHSDRSVTIVIQSEEIKEEITLTQKQFNAIILSPTEKTITSAGETFDVVVSANIELDEIKFENAEGEPIDWITQVEATTRTLKDTPLQFIVSPNDQTAERIGLIIISSGELSETLTVTQKQLNTIIVSPTAKTITSVGEEFDVIVSANVELDEIKIEHVQGTGWITQVKTTTRTLDKTILKFLVLANDQTEERVGSIIVSSGELSQTIIVTQEAIPTIALSTTLKEYTLDATNGIANNGGFYWNTTFTENEDKFTSGIFTFSRTAAHGGYYWDGFTVSNIVHDKNYAEPGGSNNWVSNQWSSMVASDISPNFLVGYWGYFMESGSGLTTFSESGFCNWVKIEDGSTTYNAKSVSIAMHPWPYYGILHGDGFARPFEAELDDSFKLLIYGVDADNNIGSTPVIHNLASYNDADELVMTKDWESIDISSLGTVKYLFFKMETTDSGDYGPNAAVYFNLNDIVVAPNN